MAEKRKRYSYGKSVYLTQDQLKFIKRAADYFCRMHSLDVLTENEKIALGDVFKKTKKLIKQ